MRLLPYFSIPVLLLSAAVGAQSQDPLPSWNDGAAKRAILDFVRETTDPSSPSFVPPGKRIANFDRAGNAWAIYLPMQELERYLRANGYEAGSEGEQEPVRVYAAEIPEVASEQVVGPEPRAGVNCLTMLVVRDHVQRTPEGTVSGTAEAFDNQAQASGWTVISTRRDWKRRFAADESSPRDLTPPLVARAGAVPPSFSSQPVL